MKKKIKSLTTSFLLIKNAKYYLISEEIISSLTPQEAKALALQIRKDQQYQLLLDAKIGDHQINGDRVVDRLEQTLNRLYSLYSWLQQDVILTEKQILKRQKWVA